MSSNSKPNRRKFISSSAAIAAAGSLGSSLVVPKPAFGFHNSVDDELKIGLVGCGGRGTSAVMNALKADSNSKVTALADAFPDRIGSTLESLTAADEKRIAVDKDHQFTGPLCHEELCKSDVDVVLLATPPHFRPAQLKAAVDAGKHVFCEKPVGVDVPGVKSVMKTCEEAAEKGLSVVSGLCWRYDLGVNEMISRIKEGQIGDIRSMEVNYYTGTLWHRGDGSVDPDTGVKRKWSPMEYQLRNWLYFNWLSGDHIAEQHIHSIDKALWLMGDEPPVSCRGMGGRLVRTEEKYGNVYDHFASVFQWKNGVKAFSNCRQMAGCYNETNDHIVGTKGRASILTWEIENEDGLNNYKMKGKPNMYDVEHEYLFRSIREGKPINNGTYMSYSTLMAIMGRNASYTGKKITWDELMADETRLGPTDYSLADYEPLPVAMPGRK
ncbi:MAG: Gfo/Idh/MocA family protein [Mariniblastus sp.]